MLFFGRLQDVAQTGERDIAISGSPSIADLIAQIGEQQPDLAVALGDERIRFAVNGTIVAADHALAPGDELAFLPPVSGGCA